MHEESKNKIHRFPILEIVLGCYNGNLDNSGSNKLEDYFYLS